MCILHVSAFHKNYFLFQNPRIKGIKYIFDISYEYELYFYIFYNARN